MQIKRMTIRFDLDNPEDRQAWEYLRGLNPASMNIYDDICATAKGYEYLCEQALRRGVRE